MSLVGFRGIRVPIAHNYIYSFACTTVPQHFATIFINTNVWRFRFIKRVVRYAFYAFIVQFYASVK